MNPILRGMFCIRPEPGISQMTANLNTKLSIVGFVAFLMYTHSLSRVHITNLDRIDYNGKGSLEAENHYRRSPSTSRI